MDDNPEGEEELPEERAPRLVAAVDGVGDTSDDADKVNDEESGRRDEEGGPFEHVELGEVSAFVGGFGSDGEVGVDAGEDFQKALEDGEQVGRYATDDPELLVPPPLLDAHSAPPHLQDSGGEDGQKEGDEPYTREVADLHSPRHVRSRMDRCGDRNGEIYKKTGVSYTWGMMNLPVRRQMAGRVQ